MLRALARAPVHLETLPHGLTLLVRESHAAPVAEVQIWAQVGSADERPGEEGLAHFHEHMLFKGTERRGVGEVAGAVEGVGGRINAYTSLDVTVYHATVPSDQVEVAFDVLADAVRFSVFDPAEIEREVEVVLEEIRRSEDSPHQVLGHAVFAEAYRVHPYRAPILGTRESVSCFDRERVAGFFRRWYAPNHLAVVVTGDGEAAQVARAVREAFSGAAPGDAQRDRPCEPPQNELRSVVLRRPFERASLDLALPTVGFGHPDAAHLDLLAFILGEGESSRLVQRVRERLALVDSIDAYSYTPLEPGLFGISADLDPERAPAALEVCVRELGRVCEEPVTSDELEKARANFLASEHFERESVTGLARKLGTFHSLAGDHRREEAYLEAIRSATPGDLHRAARDHLHLERLTVGALIPEGAPIQLDHECVARAATRGAETTRSAFSAPARLATRTEVHSFDLSNGAVVHVLPCHETPVVAVRAAFLGGLLAEDAKSAGLTSFLTSMWLRGTRTRSAADFARSVESLAADVDGFSGRSSLGLSLDCLSERLEPALDLFAEVLLEPAFTPAELERERRETLAALARREDRLGARVFDLFSETLYETHPYRLPIAGTPESVRSFTREAIAAHHERLVRAENLVLAVAGDVDPEAIAGALSSRLAGIEPGPFEAPSPPLDPPVREIRARELRKDRAQAHLVIGFRGLTVQDEDREALEVIAQILGGQGGRLFLELRDRRSLAYSVSALNVEGVAPGFFAVYIATAPNKFEEARGGLLEELKRLLGSPPTQEELQRAQHYLVGNFAIDQQRSAARAMHVALDARYGLGPEAYRDYPERIRAVRAADVLRVAQRLIDLDAYTLATIRP
jgi:zinc protease